MTRPYTYIIIFSCCFKNFKQPWSTYYTCILKFGMDPLWCYPHSWSWHIAIHLPYKKYNLMMPLTIRLIIYLCILSIATSIFMCYCFYRWVSILTHIHIEAFIVRVYDTQRWRMKHIKDLLLGATLTTHGVWYLALYSTNLWNFLDIAGCISNVFIDSARNVEFR